MNKKITIFAIILIIIGTVGTVGSSIASIPYFANTASKIEQEFNKESIIYNEKVKIDKLNINTKSTNITIKKHDKDNVLVTKKGNKSNFNYDIKNVENQLSIIENEYKDNNKNIRDLDDFTNYIIDQIYSSNMYSITVYVPNDVDINVSTENGMLNIEDDILLDNVVFKTLSGNISLPKQVKELSKLKVNSRDYIQLAMTELLGIKDVYINSESINLYSDQNDIFIDDIENYIPNNIDISQNNNSYGHIEITTDIPVANNLNINAYKASVNIDLPIEKYKINFNLKSLERISVEGLLDENIINENDYLKYEDIRELNGNLNKNSNELEKEYKVNVKSEYINFD